MGLQQVVTHGATVFHKQNCIRIFKLPLPIIIAWWNPAMKNRYLTPLE